MSTRLTQKMEAFCLKYFETHNATEAAIAAGYSRKYAAVIASCNLDKDKIQARLQDLSQRLKGAEDASVMTVLERKQKLSEVGRVDITEFVNEEGDIDLSGGNTGVIAEIHVEDWQAGKRTKKIKVHSKLQAIQELNKMEAIYTEGPQVHIDNRKIEISVVSERAKELTEGIVRGDRT